MGVPKIGLYFNMFIQGGNGLLCLLGASCSVDIAPFCCKKLYMGPMLLCIMYALWVLGMWFATDVLIYSYGGKIEGLPKDVLFAFFKVNLAPALVAQILTFKALMFTKDAGAQ